MTERAQQAAQRPTNGRTPPADLDAEGAVLSACILDPRHIDEVQLVCKPADFYATRHQVIFEGVLDLSAKGVDVDTALLAAWLRDRGRLEQVGGTPYLGELVDATPSIGHVLDHARVVAERARRRRIIAECQRVVAEAQSEVEDRETWYQTAEGRLFEAFGSQERDESIRTFRELCESEHTALQKRASRGSKFDGIPTGFSALDRKLNGLKRGVKYTLASRPGMGKTALALQVAVKVAEAGFGVVFISAEMPREQLIQRALAQVTRISSEDIGIGKVDWQIVTRAFTRLGRIPLAVDDVNAPTVAMIRSSIRRSLIRLEREFDNLHLGLVVIDYLQILQPPVMRGRSRENEVAALSAGTLGIAKEFRCAVLELSQLNRDLEKRPNKRPVLSDLRESGAVEQDSFGVLMLYRDEYYNDKTDEPHVCEVLTRKLRQGGSTGTRRLHFDGPSLAFADLADDEYAGEAEE